MMWGGFWPEAVFFWGKSGRRLLGLGSGLQARMGLSQFAAAGLLRLRLEPRVRAWLRNSCGFTM